MSVPGTNAGEPILVNSLAELSRVLDQAAGPPVLSVAVPVLEEWDSPPPPPKVPRRRAAHPERWLLGFAFAGGLWLLFCGVLVLGASARQPVAVGTAPLPVQELAIATDGLPDPVQQGRGGRAPRLAAWGEGLPQGTVGTRIAFVDNLAEAARQAREQHKLLMVLNVSGDFDDSRFT